MTNAQCEIQKLYHAKKDMQSQNHRYKLVKVGCTPLPYYPGIYCLRSRTL